MTRLLAPDWGTTTLGDCAVIARRLLRPGSLATGADIEAYERAFAEAIGVRHAVTFAAGRVALYAILQSLGIGEGDEVLLQAPTHVVVPNAVRFAGAAPVFVDCRLEDYNIDLESAAARVTPRTRAILLQHTFGVPVDMDAAQRFADAHDLVVIEDCVHALGARFGGRPIGSLGHAAFFSTEETKTISSTMGGVAVTNDGDLAADLRGAQERCAVPARSLVARYLLKQIVYHLFSHPAVHRYTRPLYLWLRERPGSGLAPGPTAASETHGERPPGYEMRLGNGQAAIALRQLRRLDANLRHRHVIAERYATALPGLGFEIPEPPPRAAPAYVRFPTRVADRAGAMDIAASRAVLGRWFTSVLEESASPEVAGYVPGSCPNAELVSRQLINLPTHPRVTGGDVAALLEALSAIRPAST